MVRCEDCIHYKVCAWCVEANNCAFYETAKVVPIPEAVREIIIDVDALMCCHAKGDIDDKWLYAMFEELKKKHTGEAYRDDLI